MLQVLNIYLIISGTFLIEFSYFKPMFLHSSTHLKATAREVKPEEEQLKLKRQSSSVPLENANDQTAVKEADPHVLTV